MPHWSTATEACGSTAGLKRNRETYFDARVTALFFSLHIIGFHAPTHNAIILRRFETFWNSRIEIKKVMSAQLYKIASINCTCLIKIELPVVCPWSWYIVDHLFNANIVRHKKLFIGRWEYHTNSEGSKLKTYWPSLSSSGSVFSVQKCANTIYASLTSLQAVRIHSYLGVASVILYRKKARVRRMLFRFLHPPTNADPQNMPPGNKGKTFQWGLRGWESGACIPPGVFLGCFWGLCRCAWYADVYDFCCGSDCM
jgi:hypothetical protein